jgi:hypothetical protein
MHSVRLVLLALLLATVILLPAVPAFADHECDNVPQCVSVSYGPAQVSRRGHSVGRDVPCPSTAPWRYNVSWDKSAPSVTVAWWPDESDHGATFRATNWSWTTDHTVTFYVGCSPVNPTSPGPPGRTR